MGEEADALIDRMLDYDERVLAGIEEDYEDFYPGLSTAFSPPNYHRNPHPVMIIARVTSIAQGEGKPYNSAHGLLYPFVVSLSDGVTGTVNAKSAEGPAYKEGDMVGYEVTGDYKGVPKIKVDKKAAENWSDPGKSIGSAAKVAPPPNSEPVDRARSVTPEGVVAIHGATVGASVNKTVDLLTRDMTHDEIVAWLCLPRSFLSIVEVASDLIRVHQHLERGHLAPTCKDRVAGGSLKAPAYRPPVPEPKKAMEEEDVPF